MKKHLIMILSVALAFQAAQGMDDRPEGVWDWKKTTVVMGAVALVGGVSYYVCRIYFRSTSESGKDCILLPQNLGDVTTRELQGLCLRAYVRQDYEIFKYLATCLMRRHDHMSLFDKHYCPDGIWDAQDCHPADYRFLYDCQKLTRLKQQIDWYWSQARFLTDLLADDFEERLCKSASTLSHQRLRNQFIIQMCAYDAQDCMQKIVEKYQKSDDKTKKLILECAQIFGHTDALIDFMYPCRRGMQNKCISFLKNKKATDVAFTWQ